MSNHPVHVDGTPELWYIDNVHTGYGVCGDTSGALHYQLCDWPNPGECIEHTRISRDLPGL